MRPSLWQEQHGEVREGKRGLPEMVESKAPFEQRPGIGGPFSRQFMKRSMNSRSGKQYKLCDMIKL
jgi:hypothetical protein